MVKLTNSTLSSIGQTVPVPHYNRRNVTTGIVHFGVGAFHRSHEAMFIDRVLAGGQTAEWGICGVGVLPSDAAMRDVFAAQDNLYTLVVKHPDGRAEARVIGSITQYLFAPDDPEAVIRTLADPNTRIVSLTVTEGGYNVNDATGEFDASNPAVQRDLAAGAVPATVFGLITEALRRRREAEVAPFTVMSCDNIQGNGVVARKALTSFALLKDEDLGEWIDRNVRFPNSMVDRITPATTDQSRAEVASVYGIDDTWPVVSESFEQWVLEDSFTLGRPALESVGVQVVDDVEPYELMKLRLLNASHQAMSYLGILAGYTYVHEVCRTPLFSTFLLSYMTQEASPTLQPVPGIDLDDYRHELIARFSSTAIADTLARQVVDGSERLPKFLLPVVRDQLASGGSIDHAALVIAAWSVYLEGSTEEGQPILVTDVRKKVLTEAVAAEKDAPGALLDVREVFGDLGENPRFREAYLAARKSIQVDGSVGAMRALAHAQRV
ncbi:mannitol dehydrogenase family protein [Subtercola sp. YIM 133946]|uniref:mannitol dehydrogenase family protein n=1 Tax=Subtercola sp. YIM 133946 TaxID=3118909 RepID=UPI002F93BCE0